MSQASKKPLAGCIAESGPIVGWLRVPADPPTRPHSVKRASIHPPRVSPLSQVVVLDRAAAIDIPHRCVPRQPSLILTGSGGSRAAGAGFVHHHHPDIIPYIAIHLKAMWYVMTDRNIRIRRGIWIIHESRLPSKT
jgi:hypothetical protein